MAISRYHAASQDSRPSWARWAIAGSATCRWVDRKRASSSAASVMTRAASHAGSAAIASARRIRANGASRANRLSPLGTGETNQIRMLVVLDRVESHDLGRHRPKRGKTRGDPLARQTEGPVAGRPHQPHGVMRAGQPIEVIGERGRVGSAVDLAVVNPVDELRRRPSRKRHLVDVGPEQAAGGRTELIGAVPDYVARLVADPQRRRDQPGLGP